MYFFLYLFFFFFSLLYNNRWGCLLECSSYWHIEFVAIDRVVMVSQSFCSSQPNRFIVFFFGCFLFGFLFFPLFFSLQEQRNGILYEFYRIMKDFATNFMEGITGAGELTLLAPSNEAFRRLGEKNLNALLANQQKLTEILHLHVIRRRLSSDEIIQNPLFSHVILPTLLVIIIIDSAGSSFIHFLFLIVYFEGRVCWPSSTALLFRLRSRWQHHRLSRRRRSQRYHHPAGHWRAQWDRSHHRPSTRSTHHDRHRETSARSHYEVNSLHGRITHNFNYLNWKFCYASAKHTRWPSKMISLGACKPTEILTILESSKSSLCWSPVTRPGNLSIARWAQLSRNSLWENILTTWVKFYFYLKRCVIDGLDWFQVRQILERHLVVGQELNINNLTSQGRDNYLQTIRGKVKIVFVESGGGI